MKKDILIVDWLLLITFILMILSKFISLPFTKIIQPIFLVLMIIHLLQHWKIFVYSLKKLKKN
ncbi:MAG: hypothetical protein U9Q06_03050 [Nanoarchaeota archaeon]|nr:hypothetical protein [Nanoarchaeota archaeon]